MQTCTHDHDEDIYDMGAEFKAINDDADEPMSIVKPHHRPSKYVTRRDYGRVWRESQKMVKYIAQGNIEGFKDDKRKCIGLSHCQVSEHPYMFFVLADTMLRPKGKKDTKLQSAKNWFFPSQVIINAQILEALDVIERLVPKREVVKKPNSKELEINVVHGYRPVTNKIKAMDGCMSYPTYADRNTERYHTIIVRYQTMHSFLGFKWLRTHTEEVEGLKAHIFQHEIDHSYGIDMYRGDGHDKKIAKPYANIGTKVNG